MYGGGGGEGHRSLHKVRFRETVHAARVALDAPAANRCLQRARVWVAGQGRHVRAEAPCAGLATGRTGSASDRVAVCIDHLVVLAHGLENLPLAREAGMEHDFVSS